MPEGKIYLFANWKMYLDTAESSSLAWDFLKIKYPENSVIAVFPSALAMTEVVKAFKGSQIHTGAQNTYWLDKGGYTGEVSPLMFKNAGCSYALVGHAERRHLFHESNHEVRQKMEAILTAGLTPVLCVGETLEERKDGQTEEVLEAQVRAAYMDIVWKKGITPIIAYEPVWAIGTGESCEAEEAGRVSSLISTWTHNLIGIQPVILYGGSARADNIKGFLDQPHISGVLVGGASAKHATWEELIGKLV